MSYDPGMTRLSPFPEKLSVGGGLDISSAAFATTTGSMFS
jgi:hypothetical protein